MKTFNTNLRHKLAASTFAQVSVVYVIALLVILVMVMASVSLGCIYLAALVTAGIAFFAIYRADATER
jgi:hypothetical protein